MTSPPHRQSRQAQIALWLVTVLVPVVAGFWVIGFGTRYSQHAMQTFLDGHRVYQFSPNAYLFWLKFPMEIGRVILCGVVGALVGFAAGRNGRVAVMTLALVQMVLFFVATFAVIAHGRDWFEWFFAMLPWNALCSIATVIGGVIARKCSVLPAIRSSAA